MLSDPARVARPPFTGRRIVLGVTGGIAAYKAIGVARDLTLAGAAVDVIETAGALEFIRPLSFEALTGRPVHVHGHTPGDPLLHIRLATEADLVLVAPATADFMARAAVGMADDLLAAVLLVATAPVILCPAMNDRMYAHPRTRANLERLAETGYRLAGPAEGLLAWGEGAGRGRMIEPIDPVRFIGNRSSGRMGFAVAAAAWRQGAEVVLVAGPSHLATPTGVRRVDVETAEEMKTAVAEELPTADALVMAAAVADFRPRAPARQKIKKVEGSVPELQMEPTPDVLRATLEMRKPDAFMVGFALETEDALQNGKRKLADKKLDLLVVNDASEAGAGFDVTTNRVTLLDPAGGVEELPLLSKDAVADHLLGRISALLSESSGD